VHGVYVEEQYLTGDQLIQGLACGIVVSKVIEDSVKRFNAASRERLEWAKGSNSPGISFEQLISRETEDEAESRAMSKGKKPLEMVPENSAIEDFVRIMHIAMAQRRLWRRFLIRRFRYDPVKRVWLAGSSFTIKDTDHLCWMMALSLFDSYESDFILGATCASIQISRGNSLKANIADVMASVHEWRVEEPFFTTISRLDSPSSTDRDREIALARLTAWAKARLKSFPQWLEASRRLSGSDLATAVFSSWREARPDQMEPVDPETVRKDMVARLSAALQEEEFLEEHHRRIAFQQRYRERKKAGDFSPMEGDDSRLSSPLPARSEEVSDPKSVEFLRKVEIDDLVSRAGLNSNELESLMLQAEGLSYKEIAATMGRSLSSVKFDLHQARKKTKKVSGK